MQCGSRMRSTSAVAFLLAALVSGATAAAGEASATTHPEGYFDASSSVQGAGAAREGAFYRKVGRFAVVVYSLWHDISPVPALESVVSASTKPARGSGGGVDYILELRVAGLGTCRALVWGVPGEGSQDWKLKYFKQEKH